MSAGEAKFSLLEDEEEENRDEVPQTSTSTLIPQKSSLRSISLSHGAASIPKDIENQTSCAELHRLAAGSTTSLSSQMKGKGSAKKLNKFYKKQNELLENFKNDSEQIEQFNRTRRRTTSKEDEIEIDEKAAENSVAAPATAPLVKQNDGNDEPEVMIFDVPRSPTNGKRRASPEKVTEPSKTKQPEEESESSEAARMAKITLLINFCLMIAKVVASVLSGSMSIISSMVDSVVDITSGLVISISERMIKKRDPYLYPRGRTRLEPLALIIISMIMGMASVQLIVSSVRGIHDALQYDLYGIGEPGIVNVTLTSVAIMVSTVFIKLFLYVVCKQYTDASVNVLAMDHRNDCISNTVALICAYLGTQYSYYFDPAGAIIVSVYILFTWVQTGREHLAKLSGKSAEPEFINRIIKVCLDHDSRISHIDTVYVYHFGSRFLVEVHIVLDENMILRDSHDISETLQSNIESLPEVERAFVHTDYDYDHNPQDEHKIV
ncbi:unnamed protein product [Caenorhabditis angaria]|uniref:Cation efflux protein cytoplasmic domain-containing protein n=1 Tax=Caenorhabditis angaria TaxID=860376 RepID=A0A9P1N9W6_9PELO|nr:unnamed protein product [Caenorhabditis angaria]